MRATIFEKKTMQQEPIDAVITWVDGSDPKHAQKMDDYLASIGKTRPKSASKTRYHNAGEIDYCVTSILKFAPWVRNIFIVTDNQQPNLLQSIQGTDYESRIQIVDHKTIFQGYEDVLPTFNSSTILTMLWRIPELSEKFLFFNDDVFLISPVDPEKFFQGDKVILRGQWCLMNEYLLHKLVINAVKKLFGLKVDTNTKRPGHRDRQQLAAKLIGFSKRYFRLPHMPHVWRKSTFADFFQKHPQVLVDNIQPKFRSPGQFVVEALAAHLEISKENVIFDKRIRNVQLKPSEQFSWRINRKLKGADQSSEYWFTCIQSIESASPEKQKLIFDWLDKRVGHLKLIIPPLAERRE